MSLYLGTSPIANTGYDKANINLSNLTNTGKNIANWSNNVTNCITEIPQDIKLEINSSGKAVLKAGSKVYIPNGFTGTTPKFDVVTIASDMTMNGGRANGTELVYVTANGASVYHYLDNSSGTDWTATSQYQCRYNTTDNMIKNTNNTGSTWLSQLSFPIAKVTLSSGTVTSIDQVFNGFGYIGSTIFALPGVKGLIPNGRNVDGTLKNIEFTIDTVKTATRTWTWDLTNNPPYQNIAYVKYNNTDVNNTIWFYNHYIESKVKPAVYTYTFWYNPDTNIMYFNGEGSDYTQCQAIFLCNTWANGTTNVVEMWGSKKSPFHALDYNDSSTISGWAMPSSRYIDLTLGASGATYTAPANGFFQFAWLGAGSSCQMYNKSSNNFWTTKEGETQSCWMPVKKSDVVMMYYAFGTGASLRWFRFYYAEGESNV